MYGCTGEKGRERRVQWKREKGKMERKFFSFYVFGYWQGRRAEKE